jgi:hypothetical protein
MLLPDHLQRLLFKVLHQRPLLQPSLQQDGSRGAGAGAGGGGGGVGGADEERGAASLLRPLLRGMEKEAEERVERGETQTSV